MGRVTITVHGRDYELVCADGEEARLSTLACELDRRVSALAGEIGARRAAADEARLLVIACLVYADELADARSRPAAAASPADDAGRVAMTRLAAELDALAARVEAVSAELADPQVTLSADRQPLPAAPSHRKL